MPTLKEAARGKVRHAIDMGVLVRPTTCERCGQLGRPSKDGRATIHAHHINGYENALDVQWLCVKCHFVYDKRPAREACSRAKLTQKQVDLIRSKYKKGGITMKSIGAEFGITKCHVHRIIRNVCWASPISGEELAAVNADRRRAIEMAS